MNITNSKGSTQIFNAPIININGNIDILDKLVSTHALEKIYQEKKLFFDTSDNNRVLDNNISTVHKS